MIQHEQTRSMQIKVILTDLLALYGSFSALSEAVGVSRQTLMRWYSARSTPSIGKFVQIQHFKPDSLGAQNVHTKVDEVDA